MARKTDYLEHELRASLQDKTGLLDQHLSLANIALWIWDLNRRDQIWFSPPFWGMLGFCTTGLSKTEPDVTEHMLPEDYKQTLIHIEQHLNNPKQAFDLVVRFRHSDGSTIWAHLKATLLNDDKNKPTRLIGTLTDITQLKELEQRYSRNLDAMDKLYASTKLALDESVEMFNASPDAILQIDLEGNIIKANKQALGIFEYSHDQLLSTNVDQLIPAKLRNAHRKHRNDYNQKPVTRDMGAVNQPLIALTKNKKEINVDVRLTPIETKFGKQVLTVVRDITDRVLLQKELNKAHNNNSELHQLATTDELTAISNRRNFIVNFEREFKRAKRHNRTLALIILDVDHFKNINDNFGHDVGDAALTFIAQNISKLLRNGDFFARLGGDEFAIYTPETDTNSSKVLMDRIFYFFESTAFCFSDHVDINISISAGITEMIEEDKSYEKLIKRADELLFQAKKMGRNKFQCDDHSQS